jgi:DNA modification methylase
MNDFFKNSEVPSGPVECLGQTFLSDEARREHFLAILREKLKDPEFRKIEGFPIGMDDDILALSDPPYYTACPNPFIEEFIKTYGKPYDASVPYSKEPFAADVSEGKNDPIYNAHSYHTKVPPKAIMRYILHYTEPGDVVFDGFCGTGMTGVAAQQCGNREEIESLGYRVENDGTILELQADTGKQIWKPISRIGERVAILNDLSTIATFIAYNYNAKINPIDFRDVSTKILANVEKNYGWMYRTLHNPTEIQIQTLISKIKTDGHLTFNSQQNVAKVNYVVWSDVLSCPDCAGSFVYWDEAVDLIKNEVLEEFPCPQCGAKHKKSHFDKSWENIFDQYIGTHVKRVRQVPVMINYSIGKKRYEKKPDELDLAILKAIEGTKIDSWIPIYPISEGDKTSDPIRIGITNLHQFYTSRNLHILAKIFSEIDIYDCDRRFKNYLRSWFTSSQSRLHRMNRYAAQHNRHVGPLANTLYVSSTPTEISPFYFVGSKIKDNTLTIKSKPKFLVTVSDAASRKAQANSVDYIFLDPPFGANIMYSELNQLLEGWLRLFTNNGKEAIQNKSQEKGLDEYRSLMASCFNEAYRLLKPGRWMTVEFSNTHASVWNGIQTALQEAGFVVSNVEALNKGRGGLHAIIGPTAVKQDLIISAYKPNGGLEERFSKAGGNEDSAWDFVRTHLKYIPSVKIKDNQLEYIAERDPRIIFDRLVAWFVRHNFQVPLSSQEFQAGLTQRFSDRDGMVFLPEQVTEYDKKRMQTSQAPQMELFIADERSAIDWLNEYLKKKPSTYQEISPEFIRQLGAGWKKYEAKPELSHLLEGNFFCYDPKDKDSQEVPSQIHSYLSTNWAEYRNLEKSDPRLKAKAADRWYVPDPNKAQELEKLREKSLLKEFEIYKTSTLRKLKEFRLEAVRAGFKSCWGNRDYATIMAVAKKIPDDVLQEDEKLLLWYDQAVTRTEDAA